MKAIVGLGNPGPDYRGSRHNIGFSVADHLSRQVVLIDEQYQGNALVARARTGNGEAVPFFLVKPLTYMNRSGQAVRKLLARGRVGLDELLVIYDDMDLELGRIRIKPSGSSGGHRGMESIIQQLGTDQFARLRCGIGRPGPDDDVIDYVLTPFKKADQELVEDMVERAVSAARLFVVEGLQAAMNAYNTRNDDSE